MKFLHSMTISEPINVRLLFRENAIKNSLWLASSSHSAAAFKTTRLICLPIYISGNETICSKPDIRTSRIIDYLIVQLDRETELCRIAQRGVYETLISPANRCLKEIAYSIPVPS